MFNLSPATFYSLACALGPCLLMLFLHKQSPRPRHRLWILLFCCYLWQVYSVTGIGGLEDIFLQAQIFRDLGIHNLSDLIHALTHANGQTILRTHVNLIPFQGFSSVQFTLNMIMTVPLGFLLPFIWYNYRYWLRTVCTGAAFSLLIESSQLLTNRTCDINDLIANTLGAALGFLLWWFVRQLFGARLRTPQTEPHQPILFIALSFAGLFFLYHPLSPFLVPYL